MHIEAACVTDQNTRARNEDAFHSAPELGLLVVADGMGGYQGGAIASRTAVDTIADFYSRSAIDGELTWPFVDPSLDEDRSQALVAIRLAHRAVQQQKRGPLASMGSTIALVALRERSAVIAHAGDSRVYLLRGGALHALTRDHSFVEEMSARGLTPEERERVAAQYGHVITRAVGIGDDLEPTLTKIEIAPRDTFLLCTDGLHGALAPEVIRDVLVMFDVELAAEVLVSRAIDAGSSDNVTAIVATLLAR
jgi:serine/threonine protein phosphatase PrpC